MNLIKSRFPSSVAVTLLSAPMALAHPGHLPMQAGATHEIQSAEHLMWWGAVGVAAVGLTCIANEMRRRARAAKRSAGAARIAARAAR